MTSNTMNDAGNHSASAPHILRDEGNDNLFVWGRAFIGTHEGSDMMTKDDVERWRVQRIR